MALCSGRGEEARPAAKPAPPRRAIHASEWACSQTAPTLPTCQEPTPPPQPPIRPCKAAPAPRASPLWPLRPTQAPTPPAGRATARLSSHHLLVAQAPAPARERPTRVSPRTTLPDASAPRLRPAPRVRARSSPATGTNGAAADLLLASPDCPQAGDREEARRSPGGRRSKPASGSRLA